MVLITYFFGFLFSGSSDKTVAEALLKLCKLYNFEIYFVHIFDYITPNKLSLDVNNIPEDNHERNEKFQSILKSMPATSCNDFIKKVKRSLFIKCAELLHCRYVFTAETTTSLAINLLSNITIGRGSQVQNDVVSTHHIITTYTATKYYILCTIFLCLFMVL